MGSRLHNRPMLDNLLRQVNKHMYIDDPDIIYFGLAVAITSRLEGEPVWGMIVGPASGGKTATLHILAAVADEHIDTVTAAGLHSWYKGSGQAQPREIGVLTRVPDPAFVTIADFSTVLRERADANEELFATLRRVYDGENHREINGPHPLHWSGRLTMLAACTAAIDKYASYSNALGPRWAYIRLRPRSTATKRSMMNKARTQASKEQQARVQKLASSLVRLAVAAAKEVEIGPALAEALDDAALAASYGRASVPRDPSYRREINGMPDIEDPPRIAKQLRMLARGLLSLGLTETETIALCSRVAVDSMPEVRGRVLAVLVGSPEPMTAAEVGRRIGCDRKVALRAMEEFECIGLARQVAPANDAWSPAGSGSTPPRPFILDGPDADLIRVVVARSQVRGPQRAGRARDETRVPTPQPPNMEAGGGTSDVTGTRFPSREARGMAQVMDVARDLVEGAISAEVTASGTTPFTGLHARPPWRPMSSPPATMAR